MSVETVANALLTHEGPWTEEDYFALGETPSRIELVDGVLVVSPLALPLHQAIIGELTAALIASRPAGEPRVYPGLNVRLWRGNIRIPDVVVARPSTNATAVPAAEVVLVVEVTSPGNFRQDLIAKHGEYAEAGIRYYVRVDLHRGAEELSAVVYELLEGGYTEIAVAADGVLRLERPWPVEIDLRAAARG